MLIMGIITITAGVLALAFPETVNEKVINYIFTEFDSIVPPWPKCLYRQPGTTDRK